MVKKLPSRQIKYKYAKQHDDKLRRKKRNKYESF